MTREEMKLNLAYVKSKIMAGMLNGTFDWHKGNILRQALDIQFEEGGDLDHILKTRFGVTDL